MYVSMKKTLKFLTPSLSEWKKLLILNLSQFQKIWRHIFREREGIFCGK
jgi:hypothetical protein